MRREVGTAMKFSSIKYFVIDAYKSLKRNRTSSLASLATVAATLFIFGVFMLTLLNVRQAVSELESKVEVKIFLEDTITIAEKSDLENTLKNIEGVKNIETETKEQALQKLREQFGEENKELLEGFEDRNPLPESFLVKVKSPEVINIVVTKVKDMPGIYTIEDGRETVDKIIAVTKTVRWIAIAIFMILIVVSVFLIGNTIKLTVYSRRREIGIMKFVGATDWFIRWPFIIEGVIIGFAGALLSTIVLYYGYSYAFSKIKSTLILVKLVQPSYVFFAISWEFMAIGIIIGAVGSITALRKFLHV